MTRRVWNYLVLLSMTGILAACASAEDAGHDKLRAIKVPAPWTQGAWSGSGGFHAGQSYHIWTLEYAATDQAVDQIRQTYDGALQSAGWTWHSSCQTTSLYSSDVQGGCWQQQDYMLIYTVAQSDGRKHNVEVKMFQDN